jgi:hypothetical protein
MLPSDVAQGGGIADALLLDLKDGDLVQQLSP